MIFRPTGLALIGAVLMLAAGASAAPRAGLTLERVVIVARHGVRPPTASNQALAPFAAQPWPAWPVAAGELTPHGGQTVRLMGRSLRQAYLGLMPASGCAAAGAVTVWADGSDERTRQTGQILSEALTPGCAAKAAWAPATPRDPIFSGDDAAPACRSDPAAAQAALLAAVGPGGVDTPATGQALKRLQAIVAPDACSGGAGTCFAGQDTVAAGPKGPKFDGPLADTATLAEDLLLEYAEGLPPAEVGWGRAASAAAIAAVMPLHERYFELDHEPYIAARQGAPMARLILAALAGETSVAGPSTGPATRLLALAGHDTNLALMRSLFGLAWTLPGQPDATAPATALAFELWSDRATGARFVRPVIHFETLDQLRTLAPAGAQRLALTFAGCSNGPMASCPLDALRRQTLARIPPGCGEL